MLDDITKRKINSLRQILVGKVPDPKSQVDQITNALIYKYMDDMDRQAEAFGGKAAFFVGEYEKYSWQKLMDPKLGGQERMNLYVEALERMSENKNLSPVFRQILRGAFVPYRSPETLNLFLAEVNGFAYAHSEELGNAYEYLLSIMGSQGDAGQFRTPRHIIDFIVKVVDPQKGDTILDPACGTGGFLVSAYKYITDDHDGKDNKTGKPTDKEKKLTPGEMRGIHKNFSGYDIDPNMAKLARVNMFLHSFPEPRIFEYDTLSDDSRWEEKFDVILANPPFMSPRGGIIPHKKFGIAATRAEVLFVDYIMEHLKSKGRAGIIVPEGIIFQSGNAYKQLRKKLVEDGLFAVVSLPSGVFNPYAGVKTSVLLFDTEMGKAQKEILFVKIENDGFDLGAQRRPIDKNDLPEAAGVLRAWRKGKKKESRLAHWVKREVISGTEDYNLSGSRFASSSRMAKVTGAWPMVKLGDVCNVYQPKTITSSEIKEFGKYKVFGANGVIGYFDEYNHEEAEIAVTCRGATCGTVNFTEPRSWITGNAMVIKPKEDRLNKRYLFFLLRGTDLSSVITGAAQPQITGAALKPFLIPLPPLEIQEQIVAELDGYQNIISGAKQIVQNWKPRIEIDPEWKMVKLGGVCNVFGGGTPSRIEEKYWGGNIPWLSARYFSDDHTIRGAEMITEEGLKNSSSKIAPKGSTILITRVSVGKFAVADKDYAINQDLTALVTKSKDLDANYLWLISGIVAERIKDSAVGVGVTGVTRDFVINQEIPLPSLAIQNQIVKKIEAERALVESNKKLIEIYEQKMKDVIAKLWN